MDVGPWVPVIAAFLMAAGGSVAGFAALRRAGAEAGQASAAATGSIVGASKEVVDLMREQMDTMTRRQEATEARVLVLERTVGSWETWGEKVLGVLDRTLQMVDTEHRAALADDVRHVKRTRPAPLREGRDG